MRDVVKTIGGLIDKANISIISSVDGEGFPNTKAMLPPRMRDSIRYIYFSTNTSSMRVKQYINNSKACVYFYDKCRWSQSLHNVGQKTYKMYPLTLYTWYHDIFYEHIISTKLIIM